MNVTFSPLTNLPATSTADLDPWLPDQWKLRQATPAT
jgi:hypothetical protein